MTYGFHEAPIMPAKNPTVLRLFFYAFVTLLISVSFLAEMLRGDCPVP